MAQTAQDVMVRDPDTVAPEAPLTEIAELMRDTRVTMVPVTEGECLRGVVTDRDIVVRAVAEGKDLDDCSAGDICTRQPLTAAPEDDVEELTDRMREAGIRRVPVVDGARVVGVLAL